MLPIAGSIVFNNGLHHRKKAKIGLETGLQGWQLAVEIVQGSMK